MVGRWLPYYLTQKRTVEQGHPLPAVFPLSVLRTSQTHSWGEIGRGHQRMDIKRWAWPDPATIVRCGHSHSQQALKSFNTVTGASGLPDKLTLHISPLGGHTRTSILTNYWCAGQWVPSPEGNKHTKDISVSCGGGAGKRPLRMLNLLCPSVLRENCYEIHTPCTVHTTAGIRQHMQDGGEITMGERKCSVFLTAFDFNTSASLTTAVSQTLTVTWACRSLGERMGTTLRSHSHTATTNHFRFSSFPTRCCYCGQTGAGFQ